MVFDKKKYPHYHQHHTLNNCSFKSLLLVVNWTVGSWAQSFCSAVRFKLDLLSPERGKLFVSSASSSFLPSVLKGYASFLFIFSYLPSSWVPDDKIDTILSTVHALPVSSSLLHLIPSQDILVRIALHC